MGDRHLDLAFPPPGHCLPKTSSMSVTDSVTAVHDFRVTGYSLIDGMGVGRYVSSRIFTVGGLDWAVRFYPDGSTVNCVGNASAFLYYCSRDKDVRARFTLNLMEKDGRLSQVTNAYMKHTFSPASDNWGFIKFIEKSKIQASPFLHNDCLTIRCLLTVAKESRTQDVETSLVTVPPSNLHTDFQNMLDDGEGADVTFDVGGQLFRAHRCVLAFRSPVFRAELFGPMKEKVTKSIEIDDMEPLIFEALLHFIYTDSLPDNYKDGRAAAIQHLLVAADRYGVDRLRLLCESKLSETIEVQTVATTLALAEQHHCSQLRQACIQYMASPNMLGSANSHSTRTRAMAMASTSSSSRPPLLHPASRTPTPPRLLPLASRASTPRPLLLFLAPPAPARGLRAAATQQPAYDDGDEIEKGDEEEEEYYSAEEDEEEMDVEAMEEEARRAAADLAARLDRELRVDGDVREKRRTIRDKTSTAKHIPDNNLPKVAVIGRPNVGKSALFNRLVGGNRAIVVDEPGVTRDRLYGRSFWGDQEFTVIDTGGVITLSKSQAGVMEELAITTTVGMDGIPLASREAAIARMPSMIEKQAVAAVEEAAVLLFLVDGQAGLVAADIEIADWLRRNFSHKCIILAVNKCESPRKGQMQALEFWSLGFTPIPISAITGTGTGELLDLVCSELKKFEGLEGLDDFEDEEDENRIPAISIVGRPNVGKSSILNALVGEDRTIVSPVSGTTRDAIDTELTTEDGQKYKLIDTAGIRRRAAVASAGSTTESLSVKRAFSAIRRSDVVALVVEAMACVTEQDYKIAERIEREGKACVIVVNKWDTIPNKNNESTTHYEVDVREKLRVLDWAPIVYCSAINGNSVEKIISAASLVEKERSRRLGTSILNQVVREAVSFKAPPRTRGGKRGRVYYTTQAAIRPPTFVLFVNDAKLFPEPYRRYMHKQLRSDAGFPGTPIRILWRSRKRTDKQQRKTNSQGRNALVAAS